MMTDPIADMLTRIRNANAIKEEKVDIPASNIKLQIAGILKKEGFIKNYKMLKGNQRGIIRIYLKYSEKEEPVITGLKRVSTPGKRVYTKKDKLPRIMGGTGIAIISTSKGILTNKECLRDGVGGEILCYVW
ncbi:MAG: 30S ribosomal protein S8 [Nitrospirota bacterium]